MTDVRQDLIARRGVMLAAAVAAVAALPGLWLPFLSSDWFHVWGAAEGWIVRTPFENFRPLCSVSYWIDWQIWGLHAGPYHFTNLVFTSASAAMLVVLVRRYTGDAVLAGITGLLFALHPYHSGNIAWIAARHDSLSALLLIGAALAYDRWRDKPRALPLAALALFEAALLAKESAVVLPAFLIVLGLFDRRRRPGRAEMLRGYLALAGVALVHFLVLRPAALEGLALHPVGYLGGWHRNLLAFAASAVVPAPPELIEAHPFFWGGLAFAATVAVLAAAWAHSRRLPHVIWPAAASFVVLLGPSLISFQQRYLFLPVAAVALALAALLRAAGRRVGVMAAALLVVGWLLATAQLWTGWHSAGRASNQLMEALVEAASQDGVQEIVVAAVPHRVHGAPVITDFSRAIALAGGPQIIVHKAGEFDYPSDVADALDGTPDRAIHREEDQVQLRLRVVRGAYSRFVAPQFPDGSDRVEKEWGAIERLDRDAVLVQIESRPGRRAYVWVGGELVPLF